MSAAQEIKQAVNKVFASNEKRSYAQVSGEALAAGLSTVAKKLDDLQRRVDMLEGFGIKYLGVWQRAQEYKRGSVVTCNGSAWIAVAAITNEMPGKSSDWQLMAKGAK